MLAIGLFIGAEPASATPPPIVFFDSGSARISAQGEAILDNAADIIREHHFAVILVEAFTDRAGSASANLRLSRRRGEAVRAALVRRGIPARKITLKAFGETRLLIETADGVSEPQNRFVRVLFDPAPDA